MEMEGTYGHHTGGEDGEAKGYLPQGRGERVGTLAAQRLVVDVEAIGVEGRITVPDGGLAYDGICVCFGERRRMAVRGDSLLGNVDLYLWSFSHLCLCHFHV